MLLRIRLHVNNFSNNNKIVRPLPSHPYRRRLSVTCPPWVVDSGLVIPCKSETQLSPLHGQQMLKEDLKIEYHLPKSATRQALPTEWISMKRVGKLIPLVRCEMQWSAVSWIWVCWWFTIQLWNAFTRYTYTENWNHNIKWTVYLEARSEHLCSSNFLKLLCGH